MAPTKKKAWTDLLGSGTPADDGTAPTDPEASKESPVTVYMHTIVGNPSNPRPKEDYSDADPEFAELKASMREIGQLQPLAVVSRHVFEKAKPEAVAQASPAARKLLRDAEWVVVTGNRRLAAGRQLGWTRIDIRVQDQLGDEAGRIDEAVIIENIHRKALSKIAEAEYLQVMVDRHGSQEEVARRIGKSQVYVSQRLALLKLAPDIQEEVDAGTLKVKEARQLAGQTSSHDEQRARVAELKARAAEPKPPRAQAERQPQNPVLKSPQQPEPTPAAGPPVQNPVLSEPPSEAAERSGSVPEPRGQSAEAGKDEQQPKKLPYDDPVYIVMHLATKMTDRDFLKLVELALETANDRDPDMLRSVLYSVLAAQSG